MEIEEDKSKEEMKPKECKRCGTKNPYDAENCRNCGKPLDKKKVTEENISKDNMEDKLMEMIEKNPKNWGSTLLEAMKEVKEES